MRLKKIIFTLVILLGLSACSSDSKDDNESTNNIPTVNAGENISVKVNASITIRGTANDSDGSIVAYEWKEGSKFLANTAIFNYLPTVVGTNTLTLSVTDEDGATASDSMVVTITEEVSSTLSNGLVAHYQFEENANDSSENGNHGIEHGGVDYVDGVIGKAGSFDGIDDYIDMNSINERITNNAWSYSIWVNKKNITTGGFILNGRNLSASEPDKNNRKNGLLWFHSNGKIVLISKGSLDNNQIKKFGQNYNLNEWYHLVYNYNGNNKHTLHINKVIDSNLTSITNGNVELVDNITFDIGRHKYNSTINELFNGKLDDLRIYNRALNESEIQELYNLKQ